MFAPPHPARLPLRIPDPREIRQQESRERRTGQSEPFLPASAAMVQGADTTGRTTRQQHLGSAPACGLERRQFLPLQREGCTAYGARGGPNRTWHQDPLRSPAHSGFRPDAPPRPAPLPRANSAASLAPSGVWRPLEAFGLTRVIQYKLESQCRRPSSLRVVRFPFHTI